MFYKDKTNERKWLKHGLELTEKYLHDIDLGFFGDEGGPSVPPIEDASEEVKQAFKKAVKKVWAPS